MKEVQKVWGKEVWVVNCEEYCGKLLYVDKGAVSSEHYHKVKQETFCCIQGQVELQVGDRHYYLEPLSEAVTIMPKQVHCFKGVANKSILMEVSTIHSDKDVFRNTESQKGQE
uniref:Putative cupin domain-containing protein n=1 Tax=viral metagenome TaxID=1070528 RepID=A0A6M3LIY8_9ZZZZ